VTSSWSLFIRLSVRYSGINPWRLDPNICPETSVRNYHYWLRNNPEERSSHLTVRALNFLIDILCYMNTPASPWWCWLDALFAHTIRSTRGLFRSVAISCCLHLQGAWISLSFLLKCFQEELRRLFEFWPITPVDSHHRVSRCHGNNWPQILASFIYSRHRFTSASSGTKYNHPVDGSSMSLRNVQTTLSSYKVQVPKRPSF
jgi:hypothetical protein